MKNKSILSILLATTLLFTSCVSNIDGNNIDGVSKLSTDAVEIWSTFGTEKVLKDKLTGYEDIKGEAKIDLLTAKGEYEGHHIILTSSDSEVEGINLVSSDLKLLGDNETIFPKENIQVFFEKYLDVKVNYDRNGLPLGKYPDALIPMQKIVEYGENKMDKNCNQGLYVRFNVPTEQKTGVYTGNLTLSYAGNTTSIPVTLTVVDLTVSEETHSRSYFISEWQYRLGELDSTQEMLEKYVEAGLEYRISPAGVVIDDTYDEEGIAYYVETATKFMQNPKCTNISIPHRSITQTVDVDGELLTASAPDPVVLEKTIEAFVEKSFVDGYDYVKKLSSHLVDEPKLNNALIRTKVATTIFKQTLEKVAQELESSVRENTQLKAQLVQSVRNIRAVITAEYDEDYVGYIDTWCPTVDYYDSEEQRAKYVDQEEKWWYTCISPRAPFPTYHIDDTLLSARTLSWMQAEYDVVGNLYWATNVYADYDGAKYNNVEDFFEGDASRFDQVNGDGYLFYPGKPYGIDGPIGSLRLEAIRDGLEEYEILYQLKQNYAQVSEQINVDFDAKNAMRNLTTDLYAGTRVSTTSTAFNSSRKALFDLAMMSNSNAKVSVIEYSDNNYGQITYKVYVADGYELYNGNELVTTCTQVDGGKIYSIINNLNKDVNELSLTVKNGEEVYTFTKALGGKVVCYDANTLASTFRDEMSSISTQLIDASSVVTDETGKLLKLDFGVSYEAIQRVILDYAPINSIDANSKKMVLRLYCDNLPESGERFAFLIQFKGKATEIALTTLTNGWNVIEASLASVNFAVNGKPQYFLMRFNTPMEKTVYLKDITVYNK